MHPSVKLMLFALGEGKWSFDLYIAILTERQIQKEFPERKDVATLNQTSEDPAVEVLVSHLFASLMPSVWSLESLVRRDSVILSLIKAENVGAVFNTLIHVKMA
jgi:hypothetical protein